ncbi:MAG: TlpA family protein disulfide reductase [Thermomicrobiales bacterium]|nr:TlpA family protein disulfide reductase [Thermomicrobiales bacterium]
MQEQPGSIESPEPAVDSSEQAAPLPRSLFRTVIVPIVALVMVGALLGVLAYALFAPEGARLADRGRVNASGALVLEDGKPARDFEITTFDGDQFRLSDQRGKIVLLNFWASWCDPCRDEMPLLTTARGALADDVIMVGVNVMDVDSDAQKFLQTYKVNYPTGPDSDDRIGIDYGVSGVPETFVVDAEGNLVAHLPGPVTSLQQLQDMVAEARK